MKHVRIKAGAYVGQDFSEHKWPIAGGGTGTIFEVEEGHPSGRMICRAAGFGATKEYGNGALYVDPKDLIWVDKESETSQSTISERRWVLIIGSLHQGIKEIYGPFNTDTEAIDYGMVGTSETVRWCVLPILKPEDPPMTTYGSSDGTS